MLVVLAILVTLVALAWPAIRKPLARHRLQAAAKHLRAELVRTRLEAIRTGQALEVRYVPGSRTYWVEPVNAACAARDRAGRQDTSAWTDMAASVPGSAAQDPRTAGLDAGAEPDPVPEKRSLPDDIFFARVEPPINGLADPAAAEAITQFDSEGAESAAEEWSQPIIFYPNGRTSDAVIELVGEHQYRLSVTLRGVTGAVSVGPLQIPATELAQHSAIMEESLDRLAPDSRWDARAPAPSVATP